jgi:hypothetical protein
MAHLIPCGGKEPGVSPDAFVALTAVFVVVEEGTATDSSSGEGGADES